MPKPDPILPEGLPEGTEAIRDDSERAKETFACVDGVLRGLDSYIRKHEDPVAAMQNAAVAAAHVAGAIYGRLNVLGIVQQPMDRLMEVVTYNFGTGFEEGVQDMSRRLLLHAAANRPRRKG